MPSPERPGTAPSVRLKRALILLAISALGLIAVGCGSDTGGGSGSEELVVDIGTEPANLDPLLKADGPREKIQLSVYEGLTARDGARLTPALAEKWERDGNAWIFHLRDGVKFHNGKTMTAEDVVASYERAISKESELLGSPALEDWKIEALDDKRVSISRPVVDPTTPARASLVMIAPKELADLSSDELSTEMVGTGPYRFEGWRRGQNMDMSAFDEYWGGAPQIKEVKVKFSPEASVRLAALDAGEIQLALNMSPELKSDRFTAKGYPSSEVSIIRLNSQHGPFKDRRLREAAALAIDKDVLLNEIYGGYGKSAGGQEIAEYVFGFNPELEQVPYDPDKARALVKEAGAEGIAVELLATKGKAANDFEAAQAVAGMLEDVGFKVKINAPPQSAWVEQIFVAEKNDAAAPDMSIYNTSNQLFDASVTFDWNLSCDGVASTTCIPDVDALAEAALKTPDEAKRQQLYAQAWEILRNDTAFLSLLEVYGLAFHDKNLSWNPPPDGFLRFQDMNLDTAS